MAGQEVAVILELTVDRIQVMRDRQPAMHQAQSEDPASDLTASEPFEI